MPEAGQIPTFNPEPKILDDYRPLCKSQHYIPPLIVSSKESYIGARPEQAYNAINYQRLKRD